MDKQYCLKVMHLLCWIRKRNLNFKNFQPNFVHSSDIFTIIHFCFTWSPPWDTLYRWYIWPGVWPFLQRRLYEVQATTPWTVAPNASSPQTVAAQWHHHGPPETRQHRQTPHSLLQCTAWHTIMELSESKSTLMVYLSFQKCIHLQPKNYNIPSQPY